jgi:hypothetical protein
MTQGRRSNRKRCEKQALKANWIFRVRGYDFVEERRSEQGRLLSRAINGLSLGPRVESTAYVPKVQNIPVCALP